MATNLGWSGQFLPWVGQDDLLARPGCWRGLRLLHRHEVADVCQHSLEVRHLSGGCFLPEYPDAGGLSQLATRWTLDTMLLRRM